jgi:uncharacterized protein YjcR
MHGGAAGSGAPIGNQNALKHGRYRKDTMKDRKHAMKERQAMLERLSLAKYFLTKWGKPGTNDPW